MLRTPLRLIGLSVAFVVSGCDAPRGTSIGASSEADRDNVAAEAAMLEEMNAVANIQAEVTARVAAEDALRAERDAMAENVLLAMPDMPVENAAGNAVEPPRSPVPTAPLVTRNDIDAAERAVQAAMEKRREGR